MTAAMTLAVVVAACGSSASTPAAAGGQDDVIRLQYGTSANCHLPIWVALDKGLFAAEGLKVEAQPATGGTVALIPLIATNKVDFATITPGPALYNAPSQGFDVRILYAENTPKAGYLSSAQFVVSQQLWDSGAVRTIQDLGKPEVKLLSIGGNNGSANNIFSDAVVAAAGLDRSKVNVVEVPSGTTLPNDVIKLFKDGKVNVAAYQSPAIDIMASQGLVHKWITYADVVPWFQDCMIASSNDYVKSHPEQTRKFLTAIVKASQLIAESNGKQTPYLAGVVGKVTGFPADQVQLIGATPNVANYGQIILESLSNVQDILVRDKLVSNTVSDTNTLIDPAPLGDVLKNVGINVAPVVPSASG